MKKLSTLFLLCILAISVNAAVITFDFGINEFNLLTSTNTSYSNYAFNDPISKDGITMAFFT